MYRSFNVFHVFQIYFSFLNFLLLISVHLIYIYIYIYILSEHLFTFSMSYYKIDRSGHRWNNQDRLVCRVNAVGWSFYFVKIVRNSVLSSTLTIETCPSLRTSTWQREWLWWERRFDVSQRFIVSSPGVRFSKLMKIHAISCQLDRCTQKICL